MFRNRRFTGFLLCATSGALAVGGVVNCLSDPRENDQVTVINTCDTNQLASDPTNPQATLRAYLQAATELKAAATSVSNELRDACNAIDTDLGLPTGTDDIAACKPIGARVAALAGKIPPFAAPPPGTPFWGELRFAPNCTPKPAALTDCIASCAGPCDTSKCDPTKLVGKCNGACTGQCVTQGDNIPCNGECVGNVPIMGPPTTCVGECDGICLSGAWSGECGGACGTIFAGFCGGTCSGLCDNVPINQPPDAGPMDAGMDADMDGGDGGAAEGGGPPPSSGLPPPPPDNAPGNCKGYCFGVCSSGANGSCNGVPCFNYTPDGGPPPVTPAPYRGYCLATCAGLCKSADGTGSTTTCSGQCTENASPDAGPDGGDNTACSGVCHGACAGTLTETVCQGALKCNQNAECENACEAHALLQTTCATPTTIETYAVSDPAFAAALLKDGPALAKAVSEIQGLRDAYAFIGNRSYGDFVAIGLQGDLARACVGSGQSTLKDSDALIRSLGVADPTVYRGAQSQ